MTLSTAVAEDNIEVREAHRRGIPVLSRAAMLAAIVALRRTIAVAGTHGKTTTSSMLALVLVEAGLRPSFIIGGDVNEIGTNAAWDEGEWLVVEADESDGTFLQLAPEIGIVTSVESDHLEYYGSFEALKAAFSALFPQRRPGDRLRGRSGRRLLGAGVGFDLRILEGRGDAGRGRRVRSQRGAFRAGPRRTKPRPVRAAGARRPQRPQRRRGGARRRCSSGSIPSRPAVRLARFAGVARRYEFRGEVGGVTFVDDYAHLPGEVRVAVDAARGGGFDRIIAVFQPHRYSRVATLSTEFADSFEGADIVVITWVYAAGEAPRPGVSGKLVLDAILRAHPGARASYVASRDELVAHLRAILRPGDICLTLAAGDLTNLALELGEDPHR